MNECGANGTGAGGNDTTIQIGSMDDAAMAARSWLIRWKECRGPAMEQNDASLQGIHTHSLSPKRNEEQMTTIKIPKRGTCVYASDSLTAHFDLSSELLKELRVAQTRIDDHNDQNASPSVNDKTRQRKGIHCSHYPIPDTWEQWDDAMFESLHPWGERSAAANEDTLSVDSLEGELDKPFTDICTELQISRDDVLLVDLQRLCSGMTSAELNSLDARGFSMEERILNLDDISPQYHPAISSLLKQLERDWPRMVEILIQQRCARMTNSDRWCKDLVRFQRKNEETTPPSVLAISYPSSPKGTDLRPSTDLAVMQLISLLLDRSNRDTQWRDAVYEELHEVAYDWRNYNSEEQEVINDEIGKVIKKIVALKRKRKSVEYELQHIRKESETTTQRDTAKYEHKIDEIKADIKEYDSRLHALRFQSQTLDKLGDSLQSMNDVLKDDCKQVHTATVQESLPGKTLSMILSRVCDSPRTENARVRRNQVLERIKTAVLQLWHKEIGSFQKRDISCQDRAVSASSRRPISHSTHVESATDANGQSNLLLSPEEEAAFFENLGAVPGPVSGDSHFIGEQGKDKIAQLNGLRQLAFM
eukprot:gb/GECG01010245.1/.p1 GENE.gb/GECG01010245.1/~~gb/GECG01010245.1/.p1  ORF type:complete len:590 (+),score=76.95 gb/GECG01010245.1/:1-1770(+)